MKVIEILILIYIVFLKYVLKFYKKIEELVFVRLIYLFIIFLIRIYGRDEMLIVILSLMLIDNMFRSFIVGSVFC